MKQRARLVQTAPTIDPGLDVKIENADRVEV
jgi:hypothetical protein